MPNNIDEALKYLTSKQVQKDSNGKIKPLTKNQAAGLIGSFIVETGSDDLSELDVVEKGNNNAGRGLAQYSHSRRGPYDSARNKAMLKGKDPNDIKFQLKYMAEEYGGKHDTDGKSLSGWTKAFEDIPDDVEGATKHFTKKYFRPSTPHLDRRIEAAQGVIGSDQPQKTKINVPERVQQPTPQRQSVQVTHDPMRALQSHQLQMQQRMIDVHSLNHQLKRFFSPFR